MSRFRGRRAIRARIETHVGRSESSVCRYPGCTTSATTTATLVAGDNATRLRVPLCAYHSDRVSGSDGIVEFLYSYIQTTAASDRFPESSAPKTQVMDRDAYVESVAAALDGARYFRGAYLPSCFHPDWFFALQAQAEANATRSPGSAAMDRAVKQLLSPELQADVKLIIRIDPVAYRTKVAAAITSPTVLRALVKDATANVEAFFGDVPLGRRIICLDIAHTRIPFIFDDWAVTARRHGRDRGIAEAVATWDMAVVDFERRGFDALVDGDASGVGETRDRLIRLLDSVLEG